MRALLLLCLAGCSSPSLQEQTAFTETVPARRHVSNQLSVASNTVIPVGSKSISSGDITSMVESQVSVLGFNPNAIYLFLSGNDITVDGDCNQCGWHDALRLPDGRASQYAWVRNPEVCSSQCSPFNPGDKTPNHNWEADSMIATLLHELAESATDPDPMTGFFGWASSDKDGSELADLCSWSFGQTYKTNGYEFNVAIGGKLYLTQQIWKRGYGCSLGVSDFVSTSTPFDLNEGAEANPPRIHYYGGRVMTKPIEVVALWYGAWHNRVSTENIINNVIDNLGASGWWGVVSDYYEEGSSR